MTLREFQERSLSVVWRGAMAVNQCLDTIAPSETPIEAETEGCSREFNWHCENGRATTYRCRSKGNVG
jgi:hypothetical protein